MKQKNKNIYTYAEYHKEYYKHNIVRMTDATFFREHHCFVFELLHTDLFEHLRATGFVGFSTDKIRDYAI